MTVKLFIHPNNGGMSWNKFVEESPAYSVALDGYVNVGPRFDHDKMIVNFNHHEEVDRLATRATCAQCLMAIRQGFFSSFRTKDGPAANVFVNDCDEDVCVSWFLLNNHYLVLNTMNPLVNKLVAMEDALDSTAGAYPFPADLPALQELAWVFAPYRQFRLNHGLESGDADAYKDIIMDVELRIMQYITGHGKSIPLNTKYKIIGGGTGWSMVEELGMHARTGMFGDGIKAYVSVRKRQTYSDRFTYTVGKLSPFIPLDLLKLTSILNKADPSVTDDDKWGGGNNIMGSPRVHGSLLSPDEIQKIIEDMIHE